MRMNRTLVGTILVDAPHSALNNSEGVPGRDNNILTPVKKIKVGRNEYPYVSGQAFRYWWRVALIANKGWKPSPITREAKIAYTSANPIVYEEDDIFGYMKAPKKKDGDDKKTLTRISPLKCSPLVSVLSGSVINDFGTFSRLNDNPVPYEYQLYSTTLKGIFSLHLEEVGKFYSEKKSGYQNFNEELKKEALEKGAKEHEGIIYLKSEDRIKRITDTIEVLPYLYGGAKQAVAHTDVSPKLIVMAVLSSPNPIFMSIVGEEEGKVKFNLEGFKQVIADYKDKILSPVFIGYRKGALPSIERDIDSLNNLEFEEKIDGKENVIKIDVVKSSPKYAVENILKWINTNLKFSE